MKSTVTSRVEVLQCCKLLYGDRREGTWIVGLLRNERLGSKAVRKNLGRRVTSRWKPR